jgi:hypothetical protein
MGDERRKDACTAGCYPLVPFQLDSPGGYTYISLGSTDRNVELAAYHPKRYGAGSRNLAEQSWNGIGADFSRGEGRAGL